MSIEPGTTEITSGLEILYKLLVEKSDALSSQEILSYSGVFFRHEVLLVLKHDAARSRSAASGSARFNVRTRPQRLGTESYTN